MKASSAGSADADAAGSSVAAASTSAPTFDHFPGPTFIWSRHPLGVRRIGYYAVVRSHCPPRAEARGRAQSPPPPDPPSHSGTSATTVNNRLWLTRPNPAACRYALLLWTALDAFLGRAERGTPRATALFLSGAVWRRVVPRGLGSAPPTSSLLRGRPPTVDGERDRSLFGGFFVSWPPTQRDDGAVPRHGWVTRYVSLSRSAVSSSMSKGRSSRACSAFGSIRRLISAVWRANIRPTRG